MAVLTTPDAPLGSALDVASSVADDKPNDAAIAMLPDAIRRAVIQMPRASYASVVTGLEKPTG